MTKVKKYLGLWQRIFTRDGGMSLIEVVLYIGISSLMIVSVITFYSIVLQSRTRHQIILEVEQQGQQALLMMTQAIRNADAINAPLMGASGSSLSLDVVDAGDDPTVFDYSANTLRITEGVQSPIDLTNDHVQVTNLTVQNLSRAGTPGVVRISLTLATNFTVSNESFDIQRTFYTSASIRP